MRHSVLLLAVLAFPCFPAVHAQQPANLLAMSPGPASCPVSLSIHQRSATEVVRTEDLPRTALGTSATPAQSLEIAFKPHRYAETIDALELRVRGVGERLQMLPLSLTADGSRADDLLQSFPLRRSAGAPTLSHAEIRVPRMNAIRWVELVSVRYTDATVWRPAAGVSCRTEPNRVLLVAAEGK